MIPGISPNSDVKYSPLETGEAIEYRSPKKVLDQDDFLKLLITQFSTQDPLNPVTDTAFIAQMAEFTACLLYTSPSPRDATLSRMPSSA